MTVFLTRCFSPLTRNILIINLITLMIPVIGFLYLADYRRELIRAEIKSLEQEGKIFADALAEGAVQQLSGGAERLEFVKALQMLRRLSSPTGSRAILFLRNGVLIADSRNQHNAVFSTSMESLEGVLQSWITFLGDQMHHGLDYLENFTLPQPYREPSDMHIHAFPHAIHALQGRVTSQVWMGKEEHQFVFSVAAPVQPLHQIFGVLVLIRHSDQVEGTIRELRQNILFAFLVAVIFTITMSLLLARQIARPLYQLVRAAERFGQPQYHLANLQIPVLGRADEEIGILSRTLATMVEKLKARILAIEGFAADVAHEIRNPISGITSALETFEIVQDPQKRAQLLSMIHAELARIDLMIDDILESSRLDAALMAEERERVDLCAWLQRFVETFRSFNPGQLISLDLPSCSVWVVIKSSRLEQVLQNILGNAQDFHPPDQAIEIALEIIAGRREIALSIIDHGPGIPEQALENIFKRFYSDRPDAQQRLHTGLGLSIAQQIIEGYNGRIIAQNSSPPQTGAVFIIVLPLLN